jgi:hypothetical protein
LERVYEFAHLSQRTNSFIRYLSDFPHSKSNGCNPAPARASACSWAGFLLMTLPVIAILFFAQRYFLQSVTLAEMKG